MGRSPSVLWSVLWGVCVGKLPWPKQGAYYCQWASYFSTGWIDLILPIMLWQLEGQPSQSLR